MPSSEIGKLPGLKVDASLAASEAAMEALGSGMGVHVSLRGSPVQLCLGVGIGAVCPGPSPKEEDGDMLVRRGTLWLQSRSNCDDEPEMGIGECSQSLTSNCESKSIKCYHTQVQVYPCRMLQQSHIMETATV